MTFLVVQPYGRHSFREATVVGEYPTASDAYNAVDATAVRLTAQGIPVSDVELLVVDEERRPVPRPAH